MNADWQPLIDALAKWVWVFALAAFLWAVNR